MSASGSIARGNENNAHQPDGTYYLGPGARPRTPSSTLGARYRLTRWLQLVAQVNNIFDHHYYSAAQLGPTVLTARGHVHREAAAGDQRRVSRRAVHVLRARRADDILVRRALHAQVRNEQLTSKNYELTF